MKNSTAPTTIRVLEQNFPEPKIKQHCLDTRPIWGPPICRITVKFRTRIEPHYWLARQRSQQPGFDNKALPGDLGYPLQCLERMPKMVKDTQKENDVEYPNTLNRYVGHVDVLRLD